MLVSHAHTELIKTRTDMSHSDIDVTLLCWFLCNHSSYHVFCYWQFPFLIVRKAELLNFEKRELGHQNMIWALTVFVICFLVLHNVEGAEVRVRELVHYRGTLKQPAVFPECAFYHHLPIGLIIVCNTLNYMHIQIFKFVHRKWQCDTMATFLSYIPFGACMRVCVQAHQSCM